MIYKKLKKMNQKTQIQKLQQKKDVLISEINLIKKHSVFGNRKKLLKKESDLKNVNQKILSLKNQQ